MLAVGCMLAISFEAQGQSSCPVEVLSVNARAVSAISGTALMINYRNATPKSINEIDLNARFGPHSQPFLLFVRHSIDAGMSATDQWGDRTWLSPPFSLGNVTVGIQKVTYSDGTEWSDNGKNQCTLSSDETAHVPLGVDLDTFHPHRSDAGLRARYAREDEVLLGQMPPRPGSAPSKN